MLMCWNSSSPVTSIYFSSYRRRKCEIPPNNSSLKFLSLFCLLVPEKTWYLITRLLLLLWLIWMSKELCEAANPWLEKITFSLLPSFLKGMLWDYKFWKWYILFFYKATGTCPLASSLYVTAGNSISRSSHIFISLIIDPCISLFQRLAKRQLSILLTLLALCKPFRCSNTGKANTWS